MAFDLGTRLHDVHMRTKLENGILHNGQPPQSVVNGFLDQGKFGAMKTLSGWEAAHCDDHQFHAKIKRLISKSLVPSSRMVGLHQTLAGNVITCLEPPLNHPMPVQVLGL